MIGISVLIFAKSIIPIIKVIGGSKYIEYIGILIFFAAILVVGVTHYMKFKKYNDIPSNIEEKTNLISVKDKNELIGVNTSNELIIQMEIFLVEAIEDETKLVEVTDSKGLAHVNNLVPGFAHVGNTAYNTAQAIQAVNDEALYRAVIPAGAKLTNSKAMEGRGSCYLLCCRWN